MAVKQTFKTSDGYIQDSDHMLDLWVRNATPWEVRTLYKEVNVSRAFISFIRSGDRVPSIPMAAAIVKTCNKLRMQAPDGLARLPELTRADLIPACASCPYFQECVKARATQEFLHQQREMQRAGVRSAPQGGFAVKLASVPQPPEPIRELDDIPEHEREYVTAGWDNNYEED